MGGFLHVLPANFLLSDITVGDHAQGKLFGLTIDCDTIWATGAAVLVIIVLGIVCAGRSTSGVPGRLQIACETGVEAVTKQVEGSIGPRGMSVIPLAIALFVFIFVCNFFEIVGLGSQYEWLLAPTADINLPLAMALFVIVLVHIASVRARGSGRLRQALPDSAVPDLPDAVQPLHQPGRGDRQAHHPGPPALRQPVLGGAHAVAHRRPRGLEAGRDPHRRRLGLSSSIIWKLFDLFIGAIQAFIFALLTILYFDMAMSTDDHDEDVVEHVPRRARAPTVQHRPASDTQKEKPDKWQTRQSPGHPAGRRHDRRWPGPGRRRRRRRHR